jgi:hypothetical protein
MGLFQTQYGACLLRASCNICLVQFVCVHHLVCCIIACVSRVCSRVVCCSRLRVLAHSPQSIDGHTFFLLHRGLR